MNFRKLLVALAAATMLVQPVLAQAPAQPASIAALVRQVNVPYEQFTLPNGLRVIVHTDRKAPIVAVSVWYHIGSKDEPKGKTGFAHLFEHLMFYGSENNDGVFFKKLEDVGATNANGTTWFDRTNYYENVPTQALDLALFLESDRMGWLLGAVTQAKLDAQRGVVQNEKREGDNAPFGLTGYATLKALFPDGHPYAHDAIGSMTDLNAASLADVQSWFRANYGPNNAVLVLAGDIDAATARPLVEKYFGAIARGPDVMRLPAPVPRWTQERRETLYDKVPTPRVSLHWPVPGRNDRDAVLTDVALTVLAGGASSRLYNELVRTKKLAVAVSGGVQAFEKVSLAEIEVTLAPGVKPEAVEAAVKQALADFIASGPSADEVSRVATRNVASTIRGLEAVGGGGGKAAALAEGLVYAGNPEQYRIELGWYANAAPADVQAAARAWLTASAYVQTVLPGERPAAEDVPPPPKVAAVAAPAKGPARMAEPAVGQPPLLQWPAIERFTLANGLKVELARRTTVPLVRMLLSVDAGMAADERSRLGIQSLALNLMDEGAAGQSGPQIAELRERLGAGIGASPGMDRTRLSLDALKSNLGPSLQLFANVVQRPDFPPAEIERVRGQMLTALQQEASSPVGIARRILSPALYGPNHPYGAPPSGLGTADSLKAITRDELVAWHKRWIRPDRATLFVAGDITAAELKPLLDAEFGQWQADASVAAGTVADVAPAAPQPARIILVDRPNSPQSLILAGTLLPITGSQDLIAERAAADVLGGLSTSRINMDIREEKNWAYGAFAGLTDGKGPLTSLIYAPVQTDRTADSIKAMIADIAAIRGPKPISDEERGRSIANSVLALPGEFERGSAFVSAMERNQLLRRPDDYYVTAARRLGALTTADLNRAVQLFDTDKLLWIVVGDRAKVEPQLKALGLPLEVRSAP
ncbi:pitrilysin family protein [Sandarakinorhabdus sp. AAP62]|uniref:M16 family metallopeptidase n=1 Tax=Sandarakinorhabdus sp. AAP62 TaxID=1248916 RepID=UPI0002F7EA49|nr:pitrilysin family protein [Sandarakinorhabdus sp. AAP62]